ncbi:MAG TPA: HAD family phosphatase [Devosia sp.]|nr:HAD family phosphatase [Devosia sp.]
MAKPGEQAYLSVMNDRILSFDAVIFDMDGTLLDTEMVFRAVVFDAARDFGFEMTDAVHLAMVGSSHEATRLMLLDNYGADFPYAAFDERCRELMKERTVEAVPVKHGALEFLAALRSRKVPLAVATSSRTAHAHRHLGRAGLLDLFDAVVTRDDVVNPKPHPEPYLTAAGRLSVDPLRCLAVEDSHTGVRAAHAAGMQTIMVPDLVRPTGEISALCVAVMESLAEVHRAAFPPMGAAAAAPGR